ncbi:MAG TPA: cell division protein FtsZ [Rhodospirillaceae bacterium]|nr:MAG: cell division protein FtsZ [Alphaproteobacteria bacterium GWF2_58_20]HAU30008.1 cell division protein FtsZ [Rhodospirillaceae bacterium]
MINIRVAEPEENLGPKITVIGVGGAGGNAINDMIRSNLEGVDFIACNTDSQALANNLAGTRIQLGTSVTSGLGAGARPEVGRASAEETLGDIAKYLEGVHMVFITAGMGGGTGTGAAPVIARAAREMGILTVGVITKPFHFEGSHRMRLAEAGIEELQQFVDTLIIIPNQNLFRVATEKTTFADAFKMADNVLYSGVRGVTDLIVRPALVNLDFADIRTVMSEMGKAMMGTGEASGEGRAIAAAEAAINNPLLDDISLKGARSMLINITGGMDISLFEIDEAVNKIREQVDPDANIIFGTCLDESLSGSMRLSVVATGIDAATAVRPAPSQQAPAHEIPAMIQPRPANASASTPNRLAQDIRVTPPAARVEAPAAPAAAPMAPEAAPQASQIQNSTFIPPAPMATRRPAQVVVQADPFGEAELANARPATQQAQAQKMGGLFSRIASPQRPQQVAQPQATVHVQPKLSIEPMESAKPARADDDTLDIPAFLRRQAN